jgi:hypothetical protein
MQKTREYQAMGLVITKYKLGCGHSAALEFEIFSLLH